MIQSLEDAARFREMRNLAWNQNATYWLTHPLRHVVDVGDYIAGRVQSFCRRYKSAPVLVDMGCGSAWLADAIRYKNIDISYVGVDSSTAFIRSASERFAGVNNVQFCLADLDITSTKLPVKADIVVNAFNFFELCDLNLAMENVRQWLRPNGTLFMSTIDKTYLILALSKDWNEFCENLRLYQTLKGTKYGFQKIDLGTAVSKDLAYPSVLYSVQDYLDAANNHEMHLVDYVEQPFTATTVPKIYCHMEFRRASDPAHWEKGQQNAAY